MTWQDITPEDIERIEQETIENYPEEETDFKRNGFKDEGDYWRWRLS